MWVGGVWGRFRNLSSLPSRIVLNLPMFRSFDFFGVYPSPYKFVFCLDKIGSVAYQLFLCVCTGSRFFEKLGMAETVLTRVHSLRERLDETLAANRNEIVALLSR